jgi:hypothetical protein
MIPLLLSKAKGMPNFLKLIITNIFREIWDWEVIFERIEERLGIKKKY